MKVFCYFVEPASYTLALATNVYDKKNINYCFIKTGDKVILGCIHTSTISILKSIVAQLVKTSD